MTFGEKLKAAREGAGISQARLSELSGIGLGTIRGYEQGQREPLLASAQLLAKVLGKTLDDLVADAEAVKPTARPKKAPPDAEDKPVKGKKGKK